MESPCYRCGAPVEEQTAFCPSCRAPQIKVSVPAASSSNQPATPPLPPGTPSSMEPPAVPLDFAQPAPIDWKRFRRSALPLSLLAGFGIIYAGLLGLVIFFGLMAIIVIRYRRYHPVPLTASQGARMGAFAGLVAFLVAIALVVFSVLLNPGEAHRQVAEAVRQWMARNPDPRVQQSIHWVTTTEGFLALSLMGTLLFLILFVILSSAVGAIAASASAKKERR